MDQVAQYFAQAIRETLNDQIKKIILFGSHARGDATPGSDYDVLVIVERKDQKIRDLVLDKSVEMLNQYDALVGSILCDEEEWERKKYFPIGLNILKEGIEL